MKGLEPSTFCMASRRSSQLSYIREGAEYSRAYAAELLAQERQDVVRLRVAAEHRLREHELVVDVDVEDPVRAGHDLDGGDRVLPLLEDPRRQTGGVRERASGNAVLDADVVTLRHRVHSVRPMRRAPRSRGCRRARCARGGRPCRSPGGCSRASRDASRKRSCSARFLTRYSPRICLTRSSESETTSSSSTPTSAARSRPCDERRVLGDVVRRDADRLAARVEHRAVLGLEHERVGRRARVAARAAVGEELRLHGSSEG